MCAFVMDTHHDKRKQKTNWYSWGWLEECLLCFWPEHGRLLDQIAGLDGRVDLNW